MSFLTHLRDRLEGAITVGDPLTSAIFHKGLDSAASKGTQSESQNVRKRDLGIFGGLGYLGSLGYGALSGAGGAAGGAGGAGEGGSVLGDTAAEGGSGGILGDSISGTDTSFGGGLSSLLGGMGGGGGGSSGSPAAAPVQIQPIPIEDPRKLYPELFDNEYSSLLDMLNNGRGPTRGYS